MTEYPGKLISKLYKNSQAFWGQYLKEYEIVSSEYPVLIILNKKDGITQEEIAHDIGIDKSAITRVVKSLMEKGFIEKHKDEDDLRCNRIYLTEKGHASWTPIQHGIQEWNRIISKNMNSGDMEELVKILSHMADNVEDYLDRQ